MLSRTRPSGLCHGCRQDLQMIFERGFCGPPVILKTRTAPLQWRRTLGSRQQLRSFTRTRIFLQQQPPSNSEPENQREDEERVEAEAEHDRLEVLKELEKALGRPIEDAIDEDRAGGEGLTDILPEAQIFEDDTPSIIRGTRDPLAVLRTSGASQEEIVREARQFYGDRLPHNALDENEYKVYRRLYGDPISTSYEEFL